MMREHGRQAAMGAVSGTENWAGLWAIWRGIKRIAACLMMAIAGAYIGGLTAGVLTFYCYFIGSWLGAPLGLIAGGILGSRMPPRDATLTFTLPIFMALATHGILVFYAVGSSLYELITVAVVALSIPVAYFLTRPLPEEWRYRLAMASAWILVVLALIAFTVSLQRPAGD